MLLDDFRIPGKDLRVVGNLELRTEDIAGETSGTDSVEKGIKPKILRVSVMLPFADANDLKALVSKAEAVDDAGVRKIYTVSHRSANAAGIRQVRFFEHLNWKEDRTLQVWQVSFTLQEYLSNPERVENRNGDMISAVDPTQYDNILKNAEDNFLA